MLTHFCDDFLTDVSIIYRTANPDLELTHEFTNLQPGNTYNVTGVVISGSTQSEPANRIVTTSKAQSFYYTLHNLYHTNIFDFFRDIKCIIAKIGIPSYVLIFGLFLSSEPAAVMNLQAVTIDTTSIRVTFDADSQSTQDEFKVMEYWLK